jgi:hypothetical protein
MNKEFTHNCTFEQTCFKLLNPSVRTWRSCQDYYYRLFESLNTEFNKQTSKITLNGSK